jgi:hypothetical protein
MTLRQGSREAAWQAILVFLNGRQCSAHVGGRRRSPGSIQRPAGALLWRLLAWRGASRAGRTPLGRTAGPSAGPAPSQVYYAVTVSPPPSSARPRPSGESEARPRPTPVRAPTINGTLCELPHTRASQIVIPPNWRLQMRKHISFAIAATIVGLAMIFWLKASAVETDTDRPRIELSSPVSNPYLSVQTLNPVY